MKCIGQGCLHVRSIVAVSFVLGLAACGGGSGGGGGGGSNALLPEAAGCAYLLDAPFNLSAAELNSGGCAYTDENGRTQFWEGTNGNFGPGFNDPDTSDDDLDSTSGDDTGGDDTGGDDIGADDTGGDDTGSDVIGGDSGSSGPINQPQSGVSFPEAQPFTSELADNGLGSVYSNSVNSALLFGPVVGTGARQNESLYKSIPFQTENIQVGIEVAHVMLVDIGSSSSASLIIHMRNTGFETQCFVSHEGISVLDAAGVLLEEESLGFVDGGINGLSSGVYTNTCIAPGEIVLMDEFILGVPFSDIASVIIKDVTSRPSSSTTSPIIVEPVSYTVSDSVINVLVANRSDTDVNIFAATIFAISSDGRSIYRDLELPDIDVLSGAEAVISIPIRFTGSVSTLRVVLDYDPL